MTIAQQIIRAVCLHETGHAIVAMKLGVTVKGVDVFAIRGTMLGNPNAVCIDGNTTTPYQRSIFSLAGEGAEEIFECGNPVDKYPLAFRALCGHIKPHPPEKNRLATHMLDDAKSFLTASSNVPSRNLIDHFHACKKQAIQLIRENKEEILFRAGQLETTAIEYGIEVRMPANGYPDDGPEWYHAVPGEERIKTIENLLRSWVKPRLAALTN